MTRRSGPDVGTVSWRILAALDAASQGVLTGAQLLRLMDENNRTKYKLQLRIDALHTWGLAYQMRDGLQIHPLGRAYLQAHRDKAAPRMALPVVPTSMATPRSVPAFKPIDIAKLMRGRPQRPGMDDLRKCPSLMGGTRVPVAASSIVIAEDA